MTQTLLKGDAGTAIPFNDITFQWREIADDCYRDFGRVFERSTYSHGPEVEAFERDFATYLGTEHAVGVNSGTSALHLATVAANIGAGDEVLVPAHTFIATVWGLIYSGAVPVLCDVDAATGTIDVADAERRVTPKTRAIIPVHLYGQPADMAAVAKIADRHGLTVIEDNAQSVGAHWNGRALGALGHLGCFSFYPGKNLGAAGEGGLVATADAALAARLRLLRNHGQAERYVHSEVGFNYRMDGLQGVVLRHKLRRLDAWTQRRRELATRYSEGLANAPLALPQIVHQDHVWHLYVVRTQQRDALREHLRKVGIETGLHYPIPLHRQPCLASLDVDRSSFPQADRWANEGLSLPLFYGMTEAQVDRVVGAVRDFFAGA